MQEEMQQFKFQNVWDLVDFPAGKYAIGTKWILKNKKDARGIVVRNKARLVAQGHRQEEGIDYDEVFAPVARIEAIRLFLAFASYMGFMVYQMDVKSAFLYGKIDEDGTVHKVISGDEVDDSLLNSADKIFQKELARLKGQEQKATSDAESLGLGFANDAEELQNNASAKTVPTSYIPVPAGATIVSTDDVPVHNSSSTDSFFDDEPTTRFPCPSDLGNHDPLIWFYKSFNSYVMHVSHKGSRGLLKWGIGLAVLDHKPEITDGEYPLSIGTGKGLFCLPAGTGVPTLDSILASFSDVDTLEVDAHEVESFDVGSEDLTLESLEAKSFVLTSEDLSLSSQEINSLDADLESLERESKARTNLLQSIPDDHMADFHYMDDARDIWNAIKARIGGNAESKKMRKSMLKQEFLVFRTGDAGEFALMGVTSE
nr:copia protein [Tanacetum cinerariifolium]